MAREIGPSGGSGGQPFRDWLLEDQQLEIGALLIWSGIYIDAIQILYRDRSNGTLRLGEKHGGNGGKLTILPLDAGQFITGMKGKTGDYVDSLVVITNSTPNTTIGYGGPGGSSPYDFEVNSGEEVIGFFGRAGDYIDQIGIFARLRP